jgi:hypothetical protein
MRTASSNLVQLEQGTAVQMSDPDLPSPRARKEAEGQAACQRQARIETVHVHEGMAGGTCVPDFERVRFASSHGQTGNTKRDL